MELLFELRQLLISEVRSAEIRGRRLLTSKVVHDLRCWNSKSHSIRRVTARRRRYLVNDMPNYEYGSKSVLKRSDFVVVSWALRHIYRVSG